MKKQLLRTLLLSNTLAIALLNSSPNIATLTDIQDQLQEIKEKNSKQDKDINKVMNLLSKSRGQKVTQDEALDFMNSMLKGLSPSPVKFLLHDDVNQETMIKFRYATSKATRNEKEFRENLKKVYENSSNDNERSEALRKYIEQEGLDKFDVSQLQLLLREFFNFGSASNMAWLLSESQNTAFSLSSLNQEFVAKAYLLQGKDNSPQETRSWANKMRNHIFNSNIPMEKARVYMARYSDLVGESYKQEYESLINEASEKELKYKAKLARNNFRNAFWLNYGAADGIRCALMSYLMGNTKEAQEMAEIVELAVLRDGGLDSNHTDVLQARILAEVLKQDDFNEDITTEYIAALKRHDEDKFATKELRLMLELIAPSLDSAQKVRSLTFTTKASSGPKFTTGKNSMGWTVRHYSGDNEEEVIQSLKDNSFSYRGARNNYISGNFTFGAQLYAQRINREDHVIAERLSEEPLSELMRPYHLNQVSEHAKVNLDINELAGKSLDDLDDQAFLAVADTLIRDIFHSDEFDIEDLKSPGHKRFDRAINKMIDLFGMGETDIRKQLDSMWGRKDLNKGALDPKSGTNISAAMFIGLGDCRHQAQVKQLLFDTRQRRQVNNKIKELSQTKDTSERKSIREEILNILSTELRTADLVIHAQNELKRDSKGNPMMYFIERDSSGTPKYSDELHALEEHTSHFLFKGGKYKNGKFQGGDVYLCDSFYHYGYPWAYAQFTPKVDQDGKIDTQTTVNTVKDDGSEQEVNVYITPTMYAGTRSKHDAGDANITLLGQELAPASDLINASKGTQSFDTSHFILEQLRVKNRDAMFEKIKTIGNTELTPEEIEEADKIEQKVREQRGEL